MDDTPADVPAPGDKTMSGSKAWVIAALVAAALIAVIGGALVAGHASTDTRSNGQSGSSSSQSRSTGTSWSSTPNGPATAGWMRAGCAGWAQDYDHADGPSSDWCASMATWMAANGWGAPGGQSAPMMGAMMGGNAAAMRDACDAWVASSPSTSSSTSPGAAAPRDWCDQMANWMADHHGSWDN